MVSNNECGEILMSINIPQSEEPIREEGESSQNQEADQEKVDLTWRKLSTASTKLY